MANRNGKNPQWIHVEQAADICGLTLERYLQLARNGVLPEPFQPGLTLVDVEALERALDRLACGLDTEPLQLIIDEEESDSLSAEPETAIAQIRNRNRLSLALLGLFCMALFVLIKSVQVTLG